jgi:hypothetical protein
MKKTLFVAAIMLAILIVIPTLALSEAINVNTPIQITTTSSYDRNPCLLKANGIYWLFYTSDRDNTGTRDGYNPDLDYYDIYFRTSKSVEGLQAAPDQLLGSESTYPDNAQRDLAAVQTDDGKIWLFASTGLGPGAERSIYYYIYDGVWSGPTPIQADSKLVTDYAAHLDALTYNGRIWVFFDMGYNLYMTNYDGAVWSTPIKVQSDATLAKAIVTEGTFYVVWVPMTSEWTSYCGSGIYLSTSTDGNTWASTSTPIASWPSTDATNWDPAIIKDKNVFKLFWAPDIGTGGQFIATSTSKTPQNPASWSAPTALTTSSNGVNNWWDFWPEPCTKGNALYLFYTSERNSAGTARIDANIWLMQLSR